MSAGGKVQIVYTKIFALLGPHAFALLKYTIILLKS